MTKKADRLQVLLTKIEAGEPVENLKTGLSVDMVELLEIALSLHDLKTPKRSAEMVSTQRRNLKQISNQQKKDLLKMNDKNSDFFGNLLSRLPFKLTKKSLAILSAAFLLVSAVLVMGGNQAPGEESVGSGPGVVGTNQGGTIDLADHVSEASGPQHAVMVNLHGIVEVQTLDGSWEPAAANDLLTAGDRVRSGTLSGLTLVFFDGSTIKIGPNAELSLDDINAPKAGDDPRTIVVTQWMGKSDHDVAHSDDPDSLYEVNTPAGKGVAQGTSFQVVVTTTLLVNFTVDDGSIAVTNMNVTVIVIAGQTTSVNPDGEPENPKFFVKGEGRVTANSYAWHISGTAFLTDEDTVIIGDPMVGDWVYFECHMQDTSRIATRIILLRRAPENAFDFSGVVEEIGSDAWTISGQNVTVDANTQIDPGIEVDSLVQVSGRILEGGSYLAEQIDVFVGRKFEFAGVVMEQGTDNWVISGTSIAIDIYSRIKEGILVGDAVKVEGQVLPDGTWLADEIEPAEQEDMKFEFYGVVESIDPWLVDGFGFDVDHNTEIKPGVDIGVLVKVEGLILEDGRWWADEVKPVPEIEDEDYLGNFEIIGQVESKDPWTVSGLSFSVDAGTIMSGEIELDDTVWVVGYITLDNDWVATQIREVDLDPIAGCFTITTIVREIDGNYIYFLDWSRIPVTGEGVEVADLDDIEEGAVVSTTACVNPDGDVEIVSVILIYHLDSLDPINFYNDSSGGSVVICHIPPGNPSARITLTISSESVQDHLGHGDHLGPCR